MALTRAQLAAQSGHPSPRRALSAPKDGGALQLQERRPHLPKTRPSNRGTKRPVDTLAHDPDLPQKRPRLSHRLSLADNASDRPATNNGGIYKRMNAIDFWVREKKWPQGYFEPGLEHLRARKKSLLSLSRKRSGPCASTIPSDQKPREEKSAPYQDPRYETLLATKGSFMNESDLGLAKESKDTYLALLSSTQRIPSDTLFQDNRFKQTCQRVEDKNKVRVIRDITPLIVSSAEVLCTYGAKHLNILIESVNEGWNNAIPLTGTRPRPDYSLGFKREAFTDQQLATLSPFLGNFIAGDQSFFMATYYMLHDHPLATTSRIVTRK
ncbi:uncharacterized protein BJX67DRAFT_377383 [Aspergillus lucknowensis]|uniref:DUF7924 domain-containing protein n=1 Tax=Aspergillus lucknowensis TaxID=176173 RepID=A0ABR4M4Y8_9EURO